MEEDYYSYTRKLFHRLSYVYDLTEIVLSGTRIKVADLIDEKEDAKILDVATGTGKQAFEFA